MTKLGDLDAAAPPVNPARLIFRPNSKNRRRAESSVPIRVHCFCPMYALIIRTPADAHLARTLSSSASGVALTPLMTAPWQLVLLWGVVVGTGTGMTALVLGATVVNRWFAGQRGLVVVDFQKRVLDGNIHDPNPTRPG